MGWPLTFYVQSLPPGVGGCANGPVIRILEKYRHDRGIYEHELMHVKQWFCTLGLHPLLYLLIPAYKLWAEVQAYRKQLRYYPDNRSERFAHYISERYGLRVSYDTALTLLKDTP
jgi:hypothetical protein